MNCTGAASDVTDTLTDALQVTGLKEARVHHKSRLLSDNGPVIPPLIMFLKSRTSMLLALVFVSG